MEIINRSSVKCKPELSDVICWHLLQAWDNLDALQRLTLMSGCGAWSIDGSLIEPSGGLSNLGYV